MEKFTKIEQALPIEVSEKQDLKTTLEQLRAEDKRLREALAQEFEDDKTYWQLRGEVVEYSKKANNTMIEGNERAFHAGVLEKTLNKLNQTTRAQLEKEFNEVSLKREKAESEVAKLKRAAK